MGATAISLASLRRIVRLGAYDINGFIAQGGMGAVFSAQHRITGEHRALKVVRPDLAKNPEFVARFMREVRLAASIRHPNLVEVYEPGMEGEAVFLPMELLSGETLAALMQRTGPLSAPDVATLMLCICRGVAAIHERGILHRDLKPLNIFLALDDDGQITPKILDFGTAREVSDTEHTAIGLIVGSPHYMAPEQAAGSRDLGPEVDQYALAVIVYELLTGRRPYEGDNQAQVLSKLLCGEPYPDLRELNPQVPEAVAAVVRQGLWRDPAHRFPSVSAFSAALAAPIAQYLGSRSAVAALTGRELDLMVTVPHDLESASPLLWDHAANHEATMLLAEVEASCVISVKAEQSGVQPLAGQDATVMIESLSASSVIETAGVPASPSIAFDATLAVTPAAQPTPPSPTRPVAPMTTHAADSIILPMRGIKIGIAVVLAAVAGLALAALAAAVLYFAVERGEAPVVPRPSDEPANVSPPPVAAPDPAVAEPGPTVGEPTLEPAARSPRGSTSRRRGDRQ